jgi:hypothetical protein
MIIKALVVLINKKNLALGIYMDKYFWYSLKSVSFIQILDYFLC